MSWARCLKRVFGIEIEQCVRCGGRLTVSESIEEPEPCGVKPVRRRDPRVAYVYYVDFHVAKKATQTENSRRKLD